MDWQTGVTDGVGGGGVEKVWPGKAPAAQLMTDGEGVIRKGKKKTTKKTQRVTHMLNTSFEKKKNMK